MHYRTSTRRGTSRFVASTSQSAPTGRHGRWRRMERHCTESAAGGPREEAMSVQGRRTDVQDVHEHASRQGPSAVHPRRRAPKLVHYRTMRLPSSRARCSIDERGREPTGGVKIETLTARSPPCGPARRNWRAPRQLDEVQWRPRARPRQGPGAESTRDDEHPKLVHYRTGDSPSSQPFRCIDQPNAPTGTALAGLIRTPPAWSPLPARDTREETESPGGSGRRSGVRRARPRQGPGRSAPATSRAPGARALPDQCDSPSSQPFCSIDQPNAFYDGACGIERHRTDSAALLGRAFSAPQRTGRYI